MLGLSAALFGGWLERAGPRKAGIAAKFVSMPWEDAYRQAPADKDTCVSSVARLENRERQLVWVGELAVNKWAVFGKADFSQPVKSVADLISYGKANPGKQVFILQDSLQTLDDGKYKDGEYQGGEYQ